MASAPWLKAPWLLLRFPGLLFAVASAVIILAIATAASPLFASSAGNAVLTKQISPLCPWPIGLSVASYGPLSGDAQTFGSESQAITPAQRLSQEDRMLARDTAGISTIGPPVRTIIGPKVDAAKGGANRPRSILLLTRDGALDHVQKLSGGGNGLWITDRTAQGLGLRPGDQIRLSGEQSAIVSTRVAGIYHNLADTRVTPFWCSLTYQIYGLSAFSNFVPPPIALADRSTFLSLSARLHVSDAEFHWEYRLRNRGLTLFGASQTAGAFQGIIQRFGDFQTRESSLFGSYANASSELPAVVDQANGTVLSVKGSIDTISLAGRVVALIVVAAAGIYWVDRRRVEVSLLSAKGVGWPGLATKVLLETIPLAAVAAAFGWLAGTWLVKGLGPTSVLDPVAKSEALHSVLWTTALALALLALVAGLAARRDARTSGRAGPTLARAPWEIAVLVLAAASYYEIKTRGTAPVTGTNQAAKVDALLLLFPILFVAGGAGLVTRGLRRLLPRIRSAGTSWPPALYLSSRRLAGASRVALSLVTAAALSIGILAYAGSLATSVTATGDAKARVFTGSDVSFDVSPTVQTPRNFPFPVTRVIRVEENVQIAGVGPADILGIDRSSFAQAAFWDHSFASKPLADLVAELAPGRSGGAVPVIVVAGRLPQPATIAFLGPSPKLVPVRPVASLQAFPGLHQGRMLLVVDKSELPANGVGPVISLWVKGDPGKVGAAVRAAHIPVLTEVSARDVEATPDFLALTWTFGFLQALGVLTGLIALGCTFLYLEARQRAREVSYALSKRMGLSRRAHRRSVVVEIGAMLAVGFVVGVGLALIASRSVYRKVDPLPNIPPAPLFRTPLALLGVTALVLLAVAWIVSWRVQRVAEKADVAQVMRLAG